MKQWVVFSLPRPYRFILNFSILRHLVEINCGTPSYAPLVVRQCSGFLFSTFLPDKILNRLFGIQYLTFAQTMLYNPSSSIPLKLMYPINRAAREMLYSAVLQEYDRLRSEEELRRQETKLQIS